jgi:hypothetical protein
VEQLFDTHIARLLLLPTNFRPGRKSLPATNARAYLASSSATKKKKFNNFGDRSSIPAEDLFQKKIRCVYNYISGAGTSKLSP